MDLGMRIGPLLLLVALLLLPSAGAASVRLSLFPLVSGIDDATGGALHGELAPLEAPAPTPQGASDTPAEDVTPVAPIEAAPVAPQPGASATVWALTFGATLAGLVAAAVRGP